MTTTNRLCYTVSKRYIQAGTTFKINVKILLADDCKNNICDWSITADIYEQRKTGVSFGVLVVAVMKKY